MKKIRSFQCTDKHKFDRMVPDGVTIVQCECGELAHRVASAAKYFSNTTGKSPSR